LHTGFFASKILVAGKHGSKTHQNRLQAAQKKKPVKDTGLTENGLKRFILA